MGLRNYTETFQMSKKKLYAVICVYHKMSYMTKSPVNEGLMKINMELKSELKDFEKIEVAYVYETSSLMSARPFEVLDENTPPYYKEPCDTFDQHELSHVFFMGMAMLRWANKDENADYRLYLVTDEPFGRVNEVIWQAEGNENAEDSDIKASSLIMNPGFTDVKAQFVLVRPAGAGGDLLEQFIQESPGGRVVEI